MRAKLNRKGRVSLPITLAAIVMFAITFTLTSCGPSKAELAIMAMPSVGEVSGLWNKLIWLQGNAQSGGDYVLEIDADEKDVVKKCGILGCVVGELFYKGKSDITITLKGVGENQTIYSGFIIGSGVTLILDDNITLKGGTKFDKFAIPNAFVRVNSGGTLVMNDGSAITGTTRSDFILDFHVYLLGGGVYVDDGATFIMKGGTISGNTIRPRPFTNNEETTISLFHKDSTIHFYPGGAGVYVSGGVDEYKSSTPSPFSKKPTPSGTFIKTGGTITGYSSDQENGNVIRSADGEVLDGFGHAVYFNRPTYAKDKEPKAIDTTIGPEVTLNFKNGTLKEGGNEKSKTKKKSKKVIVEPEEEEEDEQD